MELYVLRGVVMLLGIACILFVAARRMTHGRDPCCDLWCDLRLDMHFRLRSATGLICGLIYGSRLFLTSTHRGERPLVSLLWFYELDLLRELDLLYGLELFYELDLHENDTSARFPLPQWHSTYYHHFLLL